METPGVRTCPGCCYSASSRVFTTCPMRCGWTCPVLERERRADAAALRAHGDRRRGGDPQ